MWISSAHVKSAVAMCAVTLVLWGQRQEGFWNFLAVASLKNVKFPPGSVTPVSRK